jgi:hypothetical protein
MRIFIPRFLYDRVRAQAKALGMSVSRFVAMALMRLLGMEGVPLNDEETWGEE